jgi:hypothetical protein
MPKADPEIDLKEINFPSDQITGKMIRNVFAHHFDEVEVLRDETKWSYLLEDNHYEFEGWWQVLRVERQLAVTAFDIAIGRPSTENQEGCMTTQEYRNELQQQYVDYGIAQGPQHAAELVRSFESAAANQAREKGNIR